MNELHGISFYGLGLMAYGFRLNVEAVYWQAATNFCAVAEANVKEREHRNPVTGRDEKFHGYSSDEILAPACMAVVCFAICVEAAVNYAWNEVASPKYPNKRSRKKALRTYTIKEKLNDISELGESEKSTPLVSSTELKTLDRLFELRNKFAHFKEVLEFQSFASASEVELLLAWGQIVEFQSISRRVILHLSECSSLNANFLSGKFEVVTIDA